MNSQKRSLISGLAILLFLFSGVAIAANTSCNLNIKTGKLEASEEWKIALGEDADRTCEGSTLGVRHKNPPPQVAGKPVAVAQVEQPTIVATPTPAESKTAATPLWKVDLKDITLSNTFLRWADAAGWRVRWDADKNILIDAPDSYSGSFEDAVASVLSSPGIASGPYPLEVCFYTNTPPLARITRKGEQKECK